MKKQAHTPNMQDRSFKGKLHLKIRRVRQEPRQKIRQLLRSFMPLNRLEQAPTDATHSGQN